MWRGFAAAPGGLARAPWISPRRPPGEGLVSDFSSQVSNNEEVAGIGRKWPCVVADSQLVGIPDKEERLLVRYEPGERIRGPLQDDQAVPPRILASGQLPYELPRPSCESLSEERGGLS
jgi:hypothetical protein